jgi:hypothetical protein
MPGSTTALFGDFETQKGTGIGEGHTSASEGDAGIPYLPPQLVCPRYQAARKQGLTLRSQHKPGEAPETLGSRREESSRGQVTQEHLGEGRTFCKLPWKLDPKWPPPRAIKRPWPQDRLKIKELHPRNIDGICVSSRPRARRTHCKSQAEEDLLCDLRQAPALSGLQSK